MAFVSLLLAAVISTPATPPPEIDFDAATKEAQTALDSPHLVDLVTIAMALPYKYGVTQMPCKARETQPTLGWVPAREPSGKISWTSGPITRVKWAGIYGTCSIQSPIPREQLGEIERSALECECNGWLPKGISEYPLP